MSDPKRDSLAVDLDGTLLRSDMLYESFWAAFKVKFWTPVFCILALSRGRANLKEYLAFTSTLDVARLPYDAEIIDFVENWRAQGGHTVLVTATHQTIAKAISEHLGLFDEVYGSDGQRNLKGRRKAVFLQGLFGDGSFVYMGDSRADFAVWACAKTGITVNAGKKIRQEAERLCRATKHIQTRTESGAGYLSGLHPVWLVRNALVFLPILAEGQITLSSVLWASLAFSCFTLADLSLRIIHDLIRLDLHRSDAKTRGLPFASGRLSIVGGTYVVAGTTLLTASLSLVPGVMFFTVMASYILLSLFFVRRLRKGLPSLVLMGAVLWPMRVLGGSLVASSPLPVWSLGFAALLGAGIALLRQRRRN